MCVNYQGNQTIILIIILTFYQIIPHDCLKNIENFKF